MRLGLGTDISVGYRQPLFGGVPYLLDTYTGAAAAYSLRKLRTDYTGAAIRVRESATNTEADIGFNADGSLNTTALLAHTGANDGFVVTWYDQSGNARNVTQSTLLNQPQIVSSGSVTLENSNAAINFDGLNDFLIYSNLALSNGAISIFSVRKSTNNFASGAIFDSTDNQIFASSNGVRFDNFGDNARIGTQKTLTTFSNNSANQQLQSGIATSVVRKLFLNGSEVASTSGSFAANFTSVTQHKIGAMTSATDQSAAANLFTGNIQEIIVYNGDKSADRPAIETNINTYYSIY